MWRLVFSKKADKQLSKMDINTSRIIVSWLLKNIDGCENPRIYGKGLTADYSSAWRFRIGDYRVLCDIQDMKLIILVFNIDHRRTVYKKG